MTTHDREGADGLVSAELALSSADMARGSRGVYREAAPGMDRTLDAARRDDMTDSHSV